VLPEQARGRVISLLSASKNFCSRTGGSTYQGFFSSRRSGTTFTKAIYRNPPEVKGRIQAIVSPAQTQKVFVITETKPQDRQRRERRYTHGDKRSPLLFPQRSQEALPAPFGD